MRSIWFACSFLAASAGLAEELPALTAQTGMRFCSGGGIRTIWVTVGYDAQAPGTTPPVVVPRLVRTRSLAIAVMDETGHRWALPVGFTPKVSPDSFMKLEKDGGIVLKIFDGERVVVHGLFLPFFVDRSEAERAGSRVRVILEPGKSYRLTAKVELWTKQQLQKWVESGYVTRQNATVSTIFAVPNDPGFTACEDIPPPLLLRHAHRQRIE